MTATETPPPYRWPRVAGERAVMLPPITTHLHTLDDPVNPCALDCRVTGSASTWSLRRLDALSAEVQALLNSGQEPVQQSAVAGDGDGDVGLALDSGTSGASTSGSGGSSSSDGGGARPSPMAVVTAVNTVLFERHGYRRMASHGDPRYAASRGSMWGGLCKTRACSDGREGGSI